MEIWKDIEGYEGLYQIDNMGNVKSLKDRYGNYREKILKPGKDKGNYLQVDLHKNGKRKTYYVHRLVAETFLTKIPGKEFVDHINGIRDDNRIDNLRWCTHRENDRFPLSRKNKSENNAWKGKSGELHHSSKQVLCIELNKIYGSAREAERETRIAHENISRCCNGKRKSAGGYTWKYIELLPCYN